MRQTTQAREFLGTGLAFPLSVDPYGKLATASAEQKIAQSIVMILGTARGERLMRPEFGCGVHDLVFSANDDASIGRVIDEVNRALVSYEPRIDVLDVSAETSGSLANVLLISINYRLRWNNAITNLVYPFHIREGL